MTVQMQLDDFAVTRLQVDWRPPAKRTVHVKQLESRFDYDVAVNAKDDRRFMLELRLKINEVGKQQRDVGYVIEADLAGIFSFPDDSDRETRQKLVRVNGVSMLYSTFRGVLAGITGVFPGGKLVLPSIMPDQVVRDVETRKRSAATNPEPETARRGSASLKTSGEPVSQAKE